MGQMQGNPVFNAVCALAGDRLHGITRVIFAESFIFARTNEMYGMTNLSMRLAAFLLLLACLPVAGGCGRQTADRQLSVEEWMQSDPDSCMWYYTGLYVPLAERKQYDSLENVYARILRAMPDPVPGDPDSLAYIAGWVATFYYNARMLQDKLEGGSRLTDSLAASANPFYARTLQPELMAVTAKFYVEEGRIDRVDSLGRLFERLPYTSDPRRDIRAWHSMAWAIEYCDLSTARAIALQQHAVDIFRQGRGGNGDWEVLSQMGRLYGKNGDFERASELIQEAVDRMTARPDTPGDCLLNAYNDLTDLYATLGLYDKALEANRLAAAESVRKDGWLLDEVYRRRAACFLEAGRADSALRWVAEAQRVLPADGDATLLPGLRADRMAYYMALHPDSAGRCLEECRLLLADTVRMEPEWKPEVLALYGRALLQTPGRAAEGVACLERSYRDFRAAGRPAEAVRLAEQLVRGYIGRGMEGRLASFYPAYAALRDSLWAERSRLAAIGANIRYEAGRKEQENRALAAEVELQEQVLANGRLMARAIIGLLALLAGGAVVYILLSRRYYRMKGNMHLLRINSLLDEQRVLKERNERLAEDLREREDTTGWQEPADRQPATDQQEATTLLPATGGREEEAGLPDIAGDLLDVADERLSLAAELRSKEGRLRESLGSKVLKSEELVKFRRSFMAVYPNYLADLHQRCPDLTRTDELIAMLLRLGLCNDDIALALSVTKGSVNKARTRMRRRLGLVDTGVVLEEFLRGIGEKKSDAQGHSTAG